VGDVDGCVTTAAGPIGGEAGPRKDSEPHGNGGIRVDTAHVGKAAPDFEASAYVGGEGFKNIRLSDYEGQWVILCFYPGDFTFV